MTSESRRQKLYNLIKARGEIPVSELIERLNVSGMTIRRDLDQLEKERLIRRSYGKAKLTWSDSVELPFEQRAVANLPEKQAIARLASAYVDNIDSIFVDGSTTSNELVKLLSEKKGLTVFTNSLESLLLLRGIASVNAFLIGGFLASDGNSMDGDIAISTARNIFVDAAFISCSGYSLSGLVNNGISGSHLKSIMLENSGKRFLLADHTKYNSRGLFLLGKWDKVDVFLTDTQPQDKLLDALEAERVEVHWQGDEKIPV